MGANQGDAEVMSRSKVSADIAERLQRARGLAELTVEQVAQHLGLSPTTVFRWEAGEIMPRANQLVLLAELFGCTTDFLVGNADYSGHLPVGELLVDEDIVRRILDARAAEDIEELVDWHPQMISFWQVVKPNLRVQKRRQVLGITAKLERHIQSIAPDLWASFERGVQQLQRSKLQWEQKNQKTKRDQNKSSPRTS